MGKGMLTEDMISALIARYAEFLEKRKNAYNVADGETILPVGCVIT